MRPVVVIAGPTATGKTALALAVAQHKPIEIISMDSACVYRGMDVGTAKPSAAELSAVTHHLINIRNPQEAFSAAQFAQSVQRLVPEIRARGREPLVVGGTMLYFKALADGLSDMPTVAPEIRAAIEQEARNRGWPALHRALAEFDPATAARLNPQDAQRISRAIEVFRASGTPLSAFQGARTSGMPIRLLSLEPQDRAWLHKRIEQRFDAMCAAGLVEEVRGLLSQGLSPELPALRAVGYRQAIELLQGQCSAAEFKERGYAASRQLAKRQLPGCARCRIGAWCTRMRRTLQRLGLRAL
jgi:tRNA dimethylallyltransferase